MKLFSTPLYDAASEGAAAAAAAAGAAKPWYEGADPELVGHITNKGWKDKPVNEVALDAVKSHREAERLIGAPASQLVRLPTDPTDEVGWNSVWQRLGAPANGKEGYDFSSIKNEKGEAVVSPVIDRVREVAATLKLPKETATRLATELVKFDNERTNETKAQNEVRLAEGRAALQKNWGTNFEVNKIVAQSAAAKLGVAPEAVAALESVVGYDKVMEMFRTIGTKIGEAKFIGATGDDANPGVMSVDQAKARLAELKGDTEWSKRYLTGGAPERRTMDGLIAIIASAG